MDLKFTIENQILKRTDKNEVVNLSENYLRLVFNFKTTDWDGLNKYVYFKADDGDYRFELENDELIVPSVVLTGKRFTFGLFGETENVVRITTNLVIVRLIDSQFTDGGVAILDKIDELYTIKVDYEDIVDDLVSTDVDKPLSANQGKVLKDLVDTKANTVDVNNALDGKSDKGHKHIKSDITDFSHNHTKSDITDFAHTHDDRYYTESETDTLLDGKANTRHNHTKSDITDFSHTHDDRYYTENETDNRLNTKVDKVNGKGLSSNDYTDVDKLIVDNVTNNLSLKVDKITGKGLSANDFTDAYKDVLDTFDGDWDEVINDHLDEIVAGVIEQLTTEEYYTKTQVTGLLSALQYNMDNRIALTSNPKIIQVGETADFTVQFVQDGVPVPNQIVHFFEVVEPSLTLTADKSILQTGDVADFNAKLKDEDGSLVQNTKIYFFMEEDEVYTLNDFVAVGNNSNISIVNNVGILTNGVKSYYNAKQIVLSDDNVTINFKCKSADGIEALTGQIGYSNASAEYDTAMYIDSNEISFFEETIPQEGIIDDWIDVRIQYTPTLQKVWINDSLVITASKDFSDSNYWGDTRYFTIWCWERDWSIKDFSITEN